MILITVNGILAFARHLSVTMGTFSLLAEPTTVVSTHCIRHPADLLA